MTMRSCHHNSGEVNVLIILFLVALLFFFK